MKLTGQEREQICQALLSAFPTRNSLAQWVSFGLNQNLATIAEGNNLAEGVGQLVSWAEERGQLSALMSSAVRANPSNADLQVVQSLCDWARLDQWDPWNEPVSCPYPGMSPFRIEDAEHFHGRQQEVDTLLQLLRVHRFVMVVGPSGSGKSSLVFAGLLSRLGTSSFWKAGHWLVRQMRPSASPVQRLEQVLEGDVETLSTTLQSLLQAYAPGIQLLLFVDQFEELFTQASTTDQQRFIHCLQTLRKDPNCTLLLTMRADFYPELMNSGLWPVPINERLEVAPLRGEPLREAIAQPAADVKVTLDADLLERLLADAADEPGVLPLLQETLVLLWNKMRRRRLTLAVYEQLGRENRSGLMVALSLHADAFLASLSADEQRVARRILLRLVQFGEGRPNTRRQQPESALCIPDEDPALFEQTLQKLGSARLLTLSGDDGREIRVDLAHEALISGWPQFQEWLKAERKMELGRRRLLAQAGEWRRLGGQEGGLLDRHELAEADIWLAEATHIGIDSEILALIQHSRQTIQRVEQEKAAAQLRAEDYTRAMSEKARRLELEEQQQAEEVRQRVETTRERDEVRVQAAEAAEKSKRRQQQGMILVVVVVIFVFRFLFSYANTAREEQQAQAAKDMQATLQYAQLEQLFQDVAATPERLSISDFVSYYFQDVAVRSTITILDIRSAAEYTADHIPDAINIPVEEIHQRANEVSIDRLAIIYCDCPDDIDSVNIGRQLISEYGIQALVLDGGWSAWKSAQVPTPAVP